MSITATELKSNLGKYLMLARTEDIYITRNGKIVAKLSNPQQDKIDVAKSLFGVLPADMTLEEAREERLNQICKPSWIPASSLMRSRTDSHFARMLRRFFCYVQMMSLKAF